MMDLRLEAAVGCKIIEKKNQKTTEQKKEQKKKKQKQKTKTEITEKKH